MIGKRLIWHEIGRQPGEFCYRLSRRGNTTYAQCQKKPGSVFVIRSCFQGPQSNQVTGVKLVIQISSSLHSFRILIEKI